MSGRRRLAECHPVLASATPQTRLEIAKTLLDFMRRELAMKVDYLDPIAQERIQQQSSQRLIAPWALDENEKMEHAAVLYPRPFRRGQDYGGDVYLSPRSGFGQYLRRPSTFPNYQERLSLDETQIVCRELLEALKIAGLTEIVAPPREKDDVPGYQLPASVLSWVAGDGTRPFHDPIRVPRASETGGRTNAFFVDFYRTIAAAGTGLEAREHTAQVPYDRAYRRARSASARGNCRSSTAPPPWNSGWILQSSTSSTCATFHQRRPTMPSVVAGPDAVASRPWSLRTVPPFSSA